MSSELVLNIQTRNVVGKKVKLLRRQGLVPATVYGKGFSPLSVQVDGRSFERVYRTAGKTSLVELTIDGAQKKSVFVRDIQRHPVTRTIIHADFHVVDLKAELTADVPITIVGSSVLVDRGDAIIQQGLHTLHVHALPSDLPHHIVVDISILEGFDSSIFVRDIPANAHYTILDAPDEMVVTLTPTRRVAEGEEDTAASGAEPVLIRKEREDAS